VNHQTSIDSWPLDEKEDKESGILETGSEIKESERLKTQVHGPANVAWTGAAGAPDSAMRPARRAIIDVGTNSVKLLVADLDGEALQPLHEESEQTRLGRGFYEHHTLQADAIRQTAAAVHAYAATAAGFGVARPRVIATSAARDATNQDELLVALRGSAGLAVEIISGDQEAEWVFRGVATDPALHDHPLLILDVGGGSTEIILGERGHYSFRQSFALGSVRLLEKFRPSDPPSLADLAACRAWLREFFDREIGPALESSVGGPLRRDLRLVGTGGTATILARMEKGLSNFDRSLIEATVLPRARVLEVMVNLWSQSLAQRRTLVGLPPSRADVILMGVAIFEAVMEHFDLTELRVSTRGLRFGALLDPG
jgi:exopolyphosphatase/guanosine-5'-triphosphate,3'-diphosphate pyrophosphatase